MHFSDSNAVGEALSQCSSENEALRQDCAMARELMLSMIMHINKGVGYYLHGGDFVESHADLMFVGSQENMEGDLRRLAVWLGAATPAVMPTIRVNHYRGSLSELARLNVRRFYNLTLLAPEFNAKVSADYAAMRALVRAGLLAADRYDLS